MQFKRSDKTVYILVGPKGSGKTYIGELIEKTLKIRFLSVEEYFMTAKKDRDDLDEEYFTEAWDLVEKRIDRYMGQHRDMLIDSIGTFKTFKKFLARLQNKYSVKLIQVKAPLNLCMERIDRLDATKHAPMKRSTVQKVNRLGLKEKHRFDGCISNANSSDDEIIAMFKLLSRKSRSYNFR